MNQQIKDQLKSMTSSMRSKHNDEIAELQHLIDTEENPSSHLGNMLAFCGDQVGALDSMDSFIDSQE